MRLLAPGHCGDFIRSLSLSKGHFDKLSVRRSVNDVWLLRVAERGDSAHVRAAQLAERVHQVIHDECCDGAEDDAAEAGLARV